MQLHTLLVKHGRSCKHCSANGKVSSKFTIDDCTIRGFMGGKKPKEVVGEEEAKIEAKEEQDTDDTGGVKEGDDEQGAAIEEDVKMEEDGGRSEGILKKEDDDSPHDDEDKHVSFDDGAKSEDGGPPLGLIEPAAGQVGGAQKVTELRRSGRRSRSNSPSPSSKKMGGLVGEKPTRTSPRTRKDRPTSS